MLLRDYFRLISADSEWLVAFQKERGSSPIEGRISSLGRGSHWLFLSKRGVLISALYTSGRNIDRPGEVNAILGTSKGNRRRFALPLDLFQVTWFRQGIMGRNRAWGYPAAMAWSWHRLILLRTEWQNQVSVITSNFIPEVIKKGWRKGNGRKRAPFPVVSGRQHLLDYDTIQSSGHGHVTCERHSGI